MIALFTIMKVINISLPALASTTVAGQGRANTVHNIKGEFDYIISSRGARAI